MPSSNHLNRGLYLAGPRAALRHFADALGIRPGDLMPDQASSFDHLRDQRNAAVYHAIAGDFRYYIEVMLWTVSEKALNAQCLALSTQGMAIVGEPDWPEQTPYDGILYHQGAAHRCGVLEDEDPDISYLFAPKPLRAEVAALSGRAPHRGW